MDTQLEKKLDKIHEDVLRVMSLIGTVFVMTDALLKRSGVTKKEYKSFMKIVEKHTETFTAELLKDLSKGDPFGAFKG